ncbi:MAG: hypothetical protein HY558_01785 [Euryarchaeota archaeon]|nr:hypothetical protein [Euryarchaeota archaeon]
MGEEPGWSVCPQCQARVKQANLERHFTAKHPGVQMPRDLAGGGRRGWLVAIMFPLLYSLLCLVLVLLLTVVFLLPKGGLQVGDLFWITALFALVVGVGLSAGK